MSPTQIEEKEVEAEIFESIQEPNLPLDSGASKLWIGQYDKRSQGNSGTWIAEFNNECNRLLSIGAHQQQEHLANQFTTYTRLTTHV